MTLMRRALPTSMLVYTLKYAVVADHGVGKYADSLEYICGFLKLKGWIVIYTLVRLAAELSINLFIQSPPIQRSSKLFIILHRRNRPHRNIARGALGTHISELQS